MSIPLTLSNVPDATPYIQYVANNGQTVYPYPFPITQDSDLVVVINGVTQNTDSTYSLSGQGNDTGGDVTLDNGSTVGDIITLYRDIQIERLTQFSQNGGFSSSSFNAEFNNLYLIAQQLEASIEQCLQIPNTNNPAPTTTLAPAAYAGKYLSFDSNGNPAPAALTVDGTLTGALVASLLSAITASPPTADKIRTPAEIAADVFPVNYSYVPMDARRFGADPTGVASSDAALTSALAVAAQLGSATIKWPAGTYLFNNPFNLNQMVGIVHEGEGAPGQSDGPATVFKYTGTGSTHWIQMTSASGCGLRNVELVNTLNTFTGAMVRCGNDGTHADSTFCFLDGVRFNSTAAPYHLDLDKVSVFWADRCIFQNGATSVKGQNSAGGSYSNVVTFRDCVWQSQAAVPTNYGGEDWNFYGCTFEELSTLQAGAFVNSLTTALNGITFKGCWFGDSTVAGGSWVTAVGNGINVQGNFISGEITGTTGLNVTGSGVVITGNVFSSLATGINLAGATNGLVIQGNDFLSVTTKLAGAANAAVNSVVNPNNPQISDTRFFDFAADGYEWSVNGKLDQWFTASVSNGDNTISFPQAFPNSCLNATATLATHQGTSATCYVKGTPGASTFVLTVVDSAGTDSVSIRAVGS